MVKKCEKCGNTINYILRCSKCNTWACRQTTCQKKQFGRNVVAGGTCPRCGGRIVREDVK